MCRRVYTGEKDDLTERFIYPVLFVDTLRNLIFYSHKKNVYKKL